MTTTTGTGVGTIAFLGGGFMGAGIIQGLLRRGLARPDDLRVCDVAEPRRRQLAERFGIATTAEQAEAVRDARFVLVAVKPQEFDGLVRDVGGRLQPDQIVISIMAGVRIGAMSERLAHDRIVRAMPNTPGGIGEGFTGWTATPNLTPAELEDVGQVLGALGGTAYFADEKYLDMVTAVSGSGPGFVLLLMEAMIDAAVHVGLRRDVAVQMVTQTFAGTARYAQATGSHPAELRNAVTSPAGTTSSGLLELERAGVRAAMTNCVIAAFERSRALGG